MGNAVYIELKEPLTEEEYRNVQNTSVVKAVQAKGRTLKHVRDSEVFLFYTNEDVAILGIHYSNWKLVTTRLLHADGSIVADNSGNTSINNIDMSSTEYYSYIADKDYISDMGTIRLKQLDPTKHTSSDKDVLESLGFFDPDFTYTIDLNQLNSPTRYFSNARAILKTALFEDTLLPDTREPGIRWSPTITADIHVDSARIMDQLRVRYAFFSRPRSGLLNVVVDSFVPRLLYKAQFKHTYLQRVAKDTISKTAVAISPWFASMLGVKQVPISDLLAILGYTPKGMRALFRKVRAKKLNLTLIGYGGTSINTMTWLTEIAKLVNAPQVFQSIAVYEPDTLEVSNLLRFPIDIRLVNDEFHSRDQPPYKVLLADNLRKLSDDVLTIPKYYDLATNYRRTHIKTYEEDVFTANTNTIMYGAPDLKTRALLSAGGNFISATHSDQACRIDLNPAQNTELQVESYGVIALSTFFMNQLKMAITFMEILASDQDLSEKDKTMLEYAFDGKTKLPKDCSRMYNFQLEHNGHVMTEEEAAQDV